MRSEKQRQASRTNGAKSRGPTSPEGKAVSKFNGLKHGLRAEHVVLPGEDPLAFEAERQGWIQDWKPISHTRAILVERAAVASWRLRRAVKAEAAFLAERADNAGYAFELERFNRAERALARADVDAVATVMLLGLDAHGLERLIASCTELAKALEAGPKAWDRPEYHVRLMLLLGRRADENPDYLGDVPRASSRLLAANNADYAAHPGLGYDVVVHPLPESEREPAAEALRRAVAGLLEGLREKRSKVDEPADLRARAVAAAYADGTEEGKLRHRYEMALDRSLRATIGQLIVLERSGADLRGEDAGAGEEEESRAEVEAGLDPQTVSQTSVASPDLAPRPESATSASMEAPGSVGAVCAGLVPTPGAAPLRASEAPNRTTASGGGGPSTR